MQKKYLTVKISDIKPNPKNPRKNDSSVPFVKNSIKQVGYISPIVIDEKNIILCGHTRLKALKELDKTEAEVLKVTGLTNEQKKIFNVADNSAGQKSEWDFDILKELDLGADLLGDLGFEDIDVDKITCEGFDEKDDVVPDAPKKAITKTGDIWKLGRHRIMCGDSTKKEDVEKLMGGKRADMVFTSPPYNLGKSSNISGNYNVRLKKNLYNNYNDSNKEYFDFLHKNLSLILECSKYVFYNLQMLSENKLDLIKLIYEFRDNLCDIAVWDKINSAPAMAERVMNSTFEFIFIFSKDNNSRAIGTKNIRGTVQNVYRGMAQINNEYASIHGATFPVHLPHFFIDNFSNRNDLILDTFLGSGSTLIACEKTNRICYGMEIDPLYVDVCVRRFEDFTGQKAVRL